MKVFLSFFLALALYSQMPASFEVASIKPNRSGGGISSIRGTKGMLTMENVALKKMILWSYGIPDDRDYALVRPDWLTSERFNIQAKFPAETMSQQVREMTQNLLKERSNWRCTARPGRCVPMRL